LFTFIQAAVKALRSVMFARDANKDYKVNGSINSLTRDLGDRVLSDLMQLLTDVVGDRNRMQYPCEREASFNIPHELYTSEKADLARHYCEEIVKLCRERVENKV
jgi:HEPN domain-containing protein